MKDPLLGTAEIVRCSQPATQRAVRTRCDLFVVIAGPGIEPFSAEVKEQVSVARWPAPGMTLPCRIDPDQPHRFEIDFTGIADWRDAARHDAARTAAGRDAADPERPVSRPGSRAVTVIGADSPLAAAEGIRKAEQALGIDLDGDGQVG